MLLCFIHSFSVAEVQAIASMIEKQAQIVVKHKEVSEESKKRKEALLAQYANITDEEEYPFICKQSGPRFTSLTDVSDRSHMNIFMRRKQTFHVVSSSHCSLLVMIIFDSLTVALKLRKRSQQVEVTVLGMINVSFLKSHLWPLFKITPNPVLIIAIWMANAIVT